MNCKSFFYILFSGGKINKLVDPSTVRIPKVKKKTAQDGQEKKSSTKDWETKEDEEIRTLQILVQ